MWMQGRDKEIHSQAAGWIARLHADDVSEGDRTAFWDWLKADDRHKAAFEMASMTWDLAGSLAITRERPKAHLGRRQLIAGTVMAGIAALGFAFQLKSPEPESYRTAQGERRNITLSDGSKLVLDTQTEIHVSYARNVRDLRLIEGRAHFDVAHDRRRPFVVHSADRQIVAIGTSFDVRNDPDKLTVLLIDGKIAVRADHEDAQDVRLLQSGDRLIFSKAGATYDRPPLDGLVSWREGRLTFANDTLASAVSELNRYAHRPIVIMDPALDAYRISGAYDAEDGEGFARAITVLLPIEAEVGAREILLRKRTITPDVRNVRVHPSTR